MSNKRVVVYVLALTMIISVLSMPSRFSNVSAEGNLVNVVFDLGEGGSYTYGPSEVTTREYSIVKGEKLNISPIGTDKPGYEFTGWLCSVDNKIYYRNGYTPGGGFQGDPDKDYIEDYIANSDVTFTAQYDTYTAYKVTVHYSFPTDSPLGEKVREYYVNDIGYVYLPISVYNSPEDVNRTYFVDYWTDSDGKKFYTDYYRVTKDTDLYSSILNIDDVYSVDVTFDYNGGYRNFPKGTDYGPYIRTYNYYSNTQIQLEGRVYKKGCTLKGWTIKNGDGTIYEAPKEVQLQGSDRTVLEGGYYNVSGEDVTFVAVWDEPAKPEDQKQEDQKQEDQKQEDQKQEDQKQDNQKQDNQKHEEPKTEAPNQEESAQTVDTPSQQPVFKNEWVDGKWYGENGEQNYSGTISWACNSSGWWIEDTAGWYPISTWQKIDGCWYYFDSSGYMASNEYVDGYWLNSDGSCSNDYYLSWKGNSTGWWVEDRSGWWPSSQWLKIDGSWYYFNSSGYMVTSQYIDGYWIGANGVCQQITDGMTKIQGSSQYMRTAFIIFCSEAVISI